MTVSENQGEILENLKQDWPAFTTCDQVGTSLWQGDQGFMHHEEEVPCQEDYILDKAGKCSDRTWKGLLIKYFFN